MYIPEAFKVHRFKDVHIPETKNLLARYGFASMPEGSYSGDEDAPTQLNKIDTLVLMAERDAQIERESQED